MSFNQDVDWVRNQPDNDEEQDKSRVSSLMDLVTGGLGDVPANLDDMEGPSPEDLAALDALEDGAELEAVPALSLLSALDEPELVSLEGLDDANIDDMDDMDDEPFDDDDDFIDSLIENYLDLDDDEPDDQGYDLKDEDDEITDYHDLYGDDDSIIPSFREEDSDDEDDSGAAFYNNLR